MRISKTEYENSSSRNRQYFKGTKKRKESRKYSSSPVHKYWGKKNHKKIPSPLDLRNSLLSKPLHQESYYAPLPHPKKKRDKIKFSLNFRKISLSGRVHHNPLRVLGDKLIHLLEGIIYSRRTRIFLFSTLSFLLLETAFLPQILNYYSLLTLDISDISLVSDNELEDLITTDQEITSDEIEFHFQPIEFTAYKIKPKDTLGEIAIKYNLKLSTLISVNSIKDVKRLSVGNTLQIPNQDGLLHKVQVGDSLDSIARKYSVSLDLILDINGLTDGVLKKNQQLFIPGGRLPYYDLHRALGDLFVYPLRGRIRVTGNFGVRKNPFTSRGYEVHQGLDLAARYGTEVFVAARGKVILQGYHRIYGKYIIVQHDNGYRTLYGHLSRILVKRGERLEQGEKIAYSGSTGRSTGPHLHFGLYRNRKAINPLSVLN